MPSVSLYAQMHQVQIEPGQIVAYILLTGGFLFLLWFVHEPKRQLGTTLILWGLLVTILSVGYGMIGVPTLMMFTTALTKIGFMLVLGGVAWSLLASCRNPGTKETDHV